VVVVVVVMVVMVVDVVVVVTMVVVVVSIVVGGVLGAITMGVRGSDVFCEWSDAGNAQGSGKQEIHPLYDILNYAEGDVVNELCLAGTPI